MYAIESVGEIVGRKKLQKMIFIAKKLQFPFQEKFNFHFYGPYSEELTLRIEELVNLNLVEEHEETNNGYQQYRYKLTSQGYDFLQMNDIFMDNFSTCFTKLNEKNARFLELVSTLLFFDTLSKEEVTEKVFTLKRQQHYTEEEVAEAYNYIDELTEAALPKM